jgi:hypothetical protein
MVTLKTNYTITVAEAFDAVRIFLASVLRRRGASSAGDIELLIGALRLADGTPVDPMLWEEWLTAVQVAASGGRAPPPAADVDDRR